MAYSSHMYASCIDVVEEMIPMSLRPSPIAPVPENTTCVARAPFPTGRRRPLALGHALCTRPARCPRATRATAAFSSSRRLPRTRCPSARKRGRCPRTSALAPSRPRRPWGSTKHYGRRGGRLSGCLLGPEWWSGSGDAIRPSRDRCAEAPSDEHSGFRGLEYGHMRDRGMGGRWQ